MRQIGWTLIVILLLPLGCSNPEPTGAESQAARLAAANWANIPMTNDRILMLVADGDIRDAVVDVPWDQETRQQGLKNGFSRAADASSTRAIYRFNCPTLQLQMLSYTVLSERGATLLSQAAKSPSSSPVLPGSTGARYLAAACADTLSPKTLQELKLS